METNMHFDKEKYEAMLMRLDVHKSEEIILNGNSDNAQSLFYQLINGAHKTINIISERLELYNTGSIVNALRKATARGVKVQVLLDGENIETSNNNFLQHCISDTNCTVKHSKKSLEYHILTRDSRAYRYCLHAKDNTAIASFNEDVITSNADKNVFGDSYSKLSTYK